jgi:hypothetical protein
VRLSPSSVRSFQERFEGSRWGRIAISGFLLLTLVATVASNLPASHLRSEILKPGQKYLNALGLEQNWGVFAPDPRRQVIGLRARITYSNGDVEIWRPPSGGPLIGTYWDYRWRKFAEFATADNQQALWHWTAAWLAKTKRQGNARPTLVTLVKRSYDLPPPGRSAIVTAPPSEHPYYDYQATSPTLGGTAR